MKQNFKTLLVAVATLLPLTALALPFVPTTDPALPSTYWYNLFTTGRCCYSSTDYYPELLTAPESSVGNGDEYLWCFVGDENSGYKVFNKHAQQYLVEANSFGGSDNSMVDYYEAGSGNSFYLYFNNPFAGFYDKYYLRYMNAEDGFIGDVIGKAAFTVKEVLKGVDATRFDSDGVGYKVIDGGGGFNGHETTDNLCDNNANTKYCGYLGDCWVTIEATQNVAVRQYSIVTGNDSRAQYQRALRNWRLEGSTDNVNFVTIDERTDCSMPFADKREVTFTVNDSRPFRYFKFTVIGNGYDIIQLSEVWINGQNHTWGDPTVYTEPTCGKQGSSVSICSDCNAMKVEPIAPTGQHDYANGTCVVCGANEGETVLLYDGQDGVPYYVRALSGVRNDDESWPAGPTAWQWAIFDDSDWQELAMPIASVGHSGGPFTSLLYNSYWYGEYNCYWLRRPFVINEMSANDVFTLKLVHDDNMVVYVNGQEVLQLEGWTDLSGDYSWANSAETCQLPASAFHSGENLLAVYIQQNYGGAYFDCSLTKSKPALSAGDVNGDGNIDGSDINVLINIILGKDTKDYQGRDDANGDGRVDGSDINMIINIILGK